MKLRSSYIIALAFLMLTAFSRRANAQDPVQIHLCVLGRDQGFGPASGNQYFDRTELTADFTPTEWCSSDKATVLMFQQDGNLVLFNDYEKITILWASNTNWTADGGPYVNGGYVFALQEDTNAVIYDINWNPLWASGTDQHNNAYLEVLDDYWGIWFTGPWRNERRYP